MLALEKLPQYLLPWYETKKRELPWRKDREFYHVWVSEIMLQQTRVEAVKGYYVRFLQELPSIAALADCDDEKLQKLWEGLGYYSRVRNLKKAAEQIMQAGGNPPTSYEEVRALSGIGPYTAGAICSICYDLPTPAVDGNVLRLMSRLQNDPSPIDLDETKKRVSEQLREIYPKEAGLFTQALMELGATVCGPNRAPDCEHCPCQELCRGYRLGTAEKLPVKSPKKERKQQERTVYILSCDGYYALRKREKRGLLAGLWEFPNTEGKQQLDEVLSWLVEQGLTPKEIYKQLHKKHIFTHIQWEMQGFYLEVKEKGGDFHWYREEEIENEIALPTAFRQFWEDRVDV